MATGAVFSLFLFKRTFYKLIDHTIPFHHYIYLNTGKAWPITLGLGFGAGMGTMNCQNKLNEPYLVMATRVKVSLLFYLK